MILKNRKLFSSVAVLVSPMSLTGCFSTQDSPAPEPTVSEVVPTETSSPEAVQQVIIPENIVGMKSDDAWITLYDLGLEVEWSEDVWMESNWTVETSYPKPGEYAAVGSTVLLKAYRKIAIYPG